MRAARGDTVDLVGRENVVACAGVLCLQTSILSLSSLASRTSCGGSVQLVGAVCGVASALGVYVVGQGRKTIKDVADTVGDRTNDAASDAVDDAVDVRGQFGVCENVAGGCEDVLGVTTSVTGLVVEEAGERL